jgi:hypothetical protein
MRKGMAGLAVVIVVMSGCGGGTPLSTYRSQEFAFSADLPGEPKAATIEYQLAIKKDKVPAKEFTVEDGDTTFLIVMNRWPDNRMEDADYIQRMMEADVLSRTSYEKVQSKGLYHRDEIPTREVIGARPDLSRYVRARMLLLRPYVYRFAVMGTKSAIESPRATRFLESATVLGGGPTTDEPEFTKFQPPPPPNGNRPAPASKVAARGPEPARAPTKSGAAVTPRSEAASVEPTPGDGDIAPRATNTPLTTEKWRVDDLDVTSLGTRSDDVLPCAVWSADGQSFFLVSRNEGLLRRVATDGLIETARLEIDRPCTWLSLSSAGLLVSVSNPQEAWLVKPDSLAVIGKIDTPGATRVVSSVGSILAFATPQRPRGGDCGQIEILDLVEGRSLGVVKSTEFKNVGFGFTSLSPDGKFLYTAGGIEAIHRFRVEDGKLAHDGSGARIGQNTQDLVLSGDGTLLALPSGGGNYVPNDLHPPQRYGTYLYKPGDLDRPVGVIESGAYPRAIGFDTRKDRVYAQNHEFDLIVFTTGGMKLQSYRLGKKRTSIGGPVKFVVHPDGGKFLVATDAGICLVEPAVGSAPVEEPSGPRSRTKPTTRSRSKR